MILFQQGGLSRIKSACFHPVRPWLLVSSIQGEIQLWNYSLGFLIKTFLGHEGPVRSVAFHPFNPIFISGGDDCTIKIWDLNLGTCIGTLRGHSDFIRTVQFHPKGLPYIVSSSDDRTARIFNYESHTSLAVLTGHEHFVMSASFHPTLPVILTGSLDHSAHIWDVSSIIKKPIDATEAYFRAPTSNDMAGPTSHRCHMDSHADGVNWAIFHPTQHLVYTASDDRTIKLWRFKQDRAWELETIAGHTDNVCCLAHHPTQNILISVSEDKTIRGFNTGQNNAMVFHHASEHRFWAVASHPTRSFFAAGHDAGFLVFKIYDDTPISTVFGSMIFYTDYSRLNCLDTQTKSISTLKSFSSPTIPAGNENYFNSNQISQNPHSLSHSGAVSALSIAASALRSNSSGHSDSTSDVDIPSSKITNISYNPVMDSLLLTHSPISTNPLSQHSTPLFRIFSKSKGIDKSDAATHAVWITPNRIATLESPHSSSISIRKLNTLVTKTIEFPFSLTGIWFAGLGYLLLEHSTLSFSIVNIKTYDPKKPTEQSIVTCKPFTTLIGTSNVIWTHDLKFCAIIAERSIVLTTRKLKMLVTIVENTSITGCVWTTVSDVPICIYSTKTHIKYASIYRVQGIIQSQKEPDQPLYIAKSQGHRILCLSHSPSTPNFKFVEIEINPSEFMLKTYLTSRKFDALKSLIQQERKSAPMTVGNALVSYMKNSGYPSVALQFATDLTTRLNLSYDCKRLDVALDCVQKLNTKPHWKRLASAALEANHLKVAELAYQKTLSFEKLSYLYFITGHSVNLSKMYGITKNHQQDLMGSLTNILLLRDSTNYIKEQIELLENAGLSSLALACAQANSLSIDLSSDIDRLAQLVPTQIDNATHGWTNCFGSELELNEAHKPLSGLKPVKDTSFHWQPPKQAKIDQRSRLLNKTKQLAQKQITADIQNAPNFVGQDWAEFGFEQDADETDFISAPKIERDVTESVNLSETASAWADSDDDDDDDEFEFDQPGANDIGSGSGSGSGPQPDKWINSLYPAHHAAQGRIQDAKSLLSSSFGVFHISEFAAGYFEQLKSLSDKYSAQNQSTPTSTAIQTIAQISHYNVLASQLDIIKVAFAQQNLPLAMQTCKQLFAQSLFWIPGLNDIPKTDLNTNTNTSSDSNSLIPKPILQLRQSCIQYFLACSLGTALAQLKSITPTDQSQAVLIQSQQLDINAYMTHLNLEPKHIGQMLFIALRKFGNKKVRHYVICHSICKRIRELVSILKKDPSMTPSDMEVYTKWEQFANKFLRAPMVIGDIPVKYNPNKEIIGVSENLKYPIYAGETHLKCSFCGSLTLPVSVPEYCTVCSLGKFI